MLTYFQTKTSYSKRKERFFMATKKYGMIIWRFPQIIAFKRIDVDVIYVQTINVETKKDVQHSPKTKENEWLEAWDPTLGFCLKEKYIEWSSTDLKGDKIDFIINHAISSLKIAFRTIMDLKEKLKNESNCITLNIDEDNDGLLDIVLEEIEKMGLKIKNKNEQQLELTQ